MARLAPLRIRLIAITSNAAGFGIFALLLWWNSVPGEGLDAAALLFALVVFGMCGVIDIYWRPWGRKAKGAPIGPEVG